MKIVEYESSEDDKRLWKFKFQESQGPSASLHYMLHLN